MAISGNLLEIDIVHEIASNKEVIYYLDLSGCLFSGGLLKVMDETFVRWKYRQVGSLFEWLYCRPHILTAGVKL